MTTGVFPSTEELIPDLLLSKIPASLVNTLVERYERLGPAYLTDKTHTDGRFINQCMFTSDIDNMAEEVVDAVFRALVRIFKNRRFESRIEDNTWAVFSGLIEIYSLLMTMKAEEVEIAPMNPWGEIAAH